MPRCPEHWSCYGRMGDNLPPPEEVSIMYLEYGIGKMRMYDADSIVIGAFQYTSVEIMVGVTNVLSLIQGWALIR